jgi:hypothetical protein
MVQSIFLVLFNNGSSIKKGHDLKEGGKPLNKTKKNIAEPLWKKEAVVFGKL